MTKKTPEELSAIRSAAGKKGGKNKKGKRAFHVIEREKALEEFKQGVMRRQRSLQNAQTVLALGGIKVFRIDYEWRGAGKNRYKIAKKPEIVVNEQEIADALDFEYGDGDSLSDEMKFYFVMTQDPDNQAIEAMWNRTFGKPKESLELSLPVSVDDKDKGVANNALAKFLSNKNKQK